jgi:hypothetical protein
MRFFLRFAGILLILTAAAKVFSSFGTLHLLDLPDPVLTIRLRYVLWFASVLEFAVGYYCVFHYNLRLQCCIIALLAASFGVYRIGLLWLGIHYCKCFGTVPEIFHISPIVANLVSLGILIYLLLVGLIGVCYTWKSRSNI